VRRKILQLLLSSISCTWKRQLGVHLGTPDIRWSLMQLRRFGFLPNNTMDVGAFRGDWARTCLDIFPHTKVVCIEPQDVEALGLKNLERTFANVKVIQALLGSSARDDVLFRDSGPGSSVLDVGSNEKLGKPRRMTTIDSPIGSGTCPPPEFLKLDVQGYEIEVLEGWTTNSDRCQVIQCEISLLPLVPGGPLLHELVAYIERRGFVMFDVTELIRSPSDGAVWQIDALFCRIDSPFRQELKWRM
jgi:FkbM family methyltransferase